MSSFLGLRNKSLFKWFLRKCPIYVKNPLKIFSRTKTHEALNLGIKPCWLKSYQVCSDDVLSWLLTFLLKGKIDFTMLHMWKILRSKFFANYWWPMYHTWHKYFMNQELGNISLSRSLGVDLCFKVMKSLFGMISPLKPLGHLWPFFIFSSLWLVEWFFFQMVMAHWPRCLPGPYMKKSLWKSFSEPRNRELRNRV